MTLLVDALLKSVCNVWVFGSSSSLLRLLHLNFGVLDDLSLFVAILLDLEQVSFSFFQLLFQDSINHLKARLLVKIWLR